MATQIEAARQLVHSAARAIDLGVKNVTRMSAMCKLMAADVAMRVTTDCVQLFGGYGYCKDYPIEKYMRDAKITQIYEGTNQIQRLVIARTLIREVGGQERTTAEPRPIAADGTSAPPTIPEPRVPPRQSGRTLTAE